MANTSPRDSAEKLAIHVPQRTPSVGVARCHADFVDASTKTNRNDKSKKC